MGKLDYIADGQMNIFDFIDSPIPEIWDADIREIIDRLDAVAEKHNMGAAYEWQVWEHVPYLGFRLSFEFRGARKQFTNALLDDVQMVCDSAKDRNIELSIMSPTFFEDASPQYMDVYSMFKDKERQKIKKGNEVKKVLREYVISRDDDKLICKHSNHECNKEELWKVADTLDETQCPHMCCRKCNTISCGARCNGSEEPRPKNEIDCDECDIQFGSITCFERRGYMYDRVHREWVKGEDGKQLRRNVDARECLKELEEPKQEAELQTSTEVTKKTCSNCLRFNMDIEQPPDGWGHIGYCVEHHEKCNDISYCSSWEPKPVEVMAYSAEEYAKAIVKYLIDHYRSWGMSEKIEQLRTEKTPDTFHKIFCKFTRIYFVPLGEWHFHVEFCKDNTVNIKRCGRDYNNRPLDATVQLQDVLDKF